MNDEILSKTKKKQQMHALQALGVELVELSRERLAQIELPERLMIEIREAQRITSHEGRRRQMQFIGKLMRETEEELIAAARERLAAWKGLSKAETTRMHTMERWRDRLVADDAPLTEFLQLHSGRRRADAAQPDPQRAQGARRGQTAARLPQIFRVVRETLEGRT
ncbi:MAG: DUF615 domain-containing protein [Betaproteobacteria bacterium]|nr:DUF615 domain-containing protein [Betaproteobacteria bacterium]